MQQLPVPGTKFFAFFLCQRKRHSTLIACLAQGFDWNWVLNVELQTPTNSHGTHDQ